MNQQAKAAAVVGGEKLSIQEIERRYPDEWVRAGGAPRRGLASR